MNDLSTKVALVTGGGRGIGREHSLLLAELGAAVVVCDLGVDLEGSGSDPSVAEATAQEIRLLGGRSTAVNADISSFAGAESAVSVAVDMFGSVDILVNNAGIAGGSTIEEVDEPGLARLMAVNFFGTIGATKAAWPHMQAKGWGRVVNTVSEVAFDSRLATGSALGYGAAKAAVWSATLSMARAGMAHGITVNAISPGARTRMNEAMFEVSPPPPGLDLHPRHVARVVGWLVSDDAQDVTGRVIHAAGGNHREYRTTRMATDLTRRLEAALEP